MRGTIIKVPDNNPGIISAEGKQYKFELTGAWRGDMAPALNQVVEFTPENTEEATAITVVSREVLAQENVNKAAKIVQQKAKDYYDILKPYVHLQIEAMTIPIVILTIFVEIAYFFWTGIQYRAPNLFLNFDYSLDQIVGMDLSHLNGALANFVANYIGMELPPRTFSSDPSGTHYGFLRFVAEILIFIPWVAPWLPIPYRKLLNALPLVTVVSIYALVHHKFHQLVSDFLTDLQQFVNSAQASIGALGGMGPTGLKISSHDVDSLLTKIMQPLSFGFGFWVALIASIALLAATFLPKRTS